MTIAEVHTPVGNKNIGISVLRCLSVCLIFFCHVLQFYGYKLAWTLNIGVQFFLAISGFLYGQREIVDIFPWIKKNMGKVICDYYVYLLIVIPVIAVFRGDIGLEQILRLLFGVGGVAGLGHLWFVLAILLCYLITPLLQRVKQKHNHLGTWVMCICAAELLGLVIQKLTGINSATWIDCYILGYFFSQKDYARKYFLYPLSCAGLVVFALESVVNSVAGLHTEGLPKYMLTLLFHNGRIFFAVGMVCFFTTTINNRLAGKKALPKLLKYVDEYSYDFYICHHLFVVGSFSILQYVSGVGGIFVCAIAAALSAILLRVLSRGIAASWGKLKKGKGSAESSV